MRSRSGLVSVGKKAKMDEMFLVKSHYPGGREQVKKRTV